MKIKIVTPFIGKFKDKGGGQDRVVYELFLYLHNHGWQVTILTQKIDEDFFQKYKNNITRIPYFKSFPQIFNEIIHMFYFTFATYDSPQALHLHGDNAFIRHHINTCHFCHSAWLRFLPNIEEPIFKKFYHFGYSFLHSILEHIILKRLAKTVVAVSEKVKKELVNYVGIPENKIKVIYNGVDTQIFHPHFKKRKEEDYLKTLYPYKKGDFILLFAGDMSRGVKGVDTILKMAEILDNPNIVILLAGSKKGNIFLKKLKTMKNSRIFFLGYRKDLDSIMRNADVFVFPTRYEPCSVVILEAMASGLPVITSKPEINGAAELIKNGINGFILKDNTDPYELKEIVLNLLKNPSMKMRIGKNARKTALKYTWENMAKKYEKLYMEILR